MSRKPSIANRIRLRRLLIFHALLAATLLPGSLSATETASPRINPIPIEEAKGVDISAPGAELRLQILSVSADQSRLWGEKGQAIQGGWKRMSNLDPIKSRLIMDKKIWLYPGTGIKVEAGGVRPIRQNIRHWLEQYGVPDTPGLMLHPIDIGVTIQGRFQNNQQVRLRLSPWLRLTQPPRITAQAQMEILPDLGITRSPKQPPSTAAPVRLNIQPLASAGFQRYISIAGANIEINISAGQPAILLASREEARALGEALLSKTINGQVKAIIFRLLLEKEL